MKIVAVVSGGPDSVGYAAIWKSKGHQIYPIVFDYGQKGSKEVEVLNGLCEKLGFEKLVHVDISSLKDLWKNTQLTDNSVKIEQKYTPSVVVPLRNGVFLMVAAAYADTIGAEKILYGAHRSDISRRNDTDEPLYPDCTPEFASSLESAINRGRFSGSRLSIHSPAGEGLTKAELMKIAYGVVGDLIFDTWSCYLSESLQCGVCESCRNRRKAFEDAGIEDKTKYAN